MSEKARVEKLEKQRVIAREEIARQKEAIRADSERDLTSANRFIANSVNSVEDTLKLQTVGFQKLEDFQLKKRALEEQRAREAARTDELKCACLISDCACIS